MSWEWTILYGLQGIHQAWLDKLMVFITHFATGGAIWICLGLLFFILEKKSEDGSLYPPGHGHDLSLWQPNSKKPIPKDAALLDRPIGPNPGGSP